MRWASAFYEEARTHFSRADLELLAEMFTKAILGDTPEGKPAEITVIHEGPRTTHVVIEPGMPLSVAMRAAKLREESVTIRSLAMQMLGHASHDELSRMADEKEREAFKLEGG